MKEDPIQIFFNALGRKDINLAEKAAGEITYKTSSAVSLLRQFIQQKKQYQTQKKEKQNAEKQCKKLEQENWNLQRLHQPDLGKSEKFKAAMIQTLHLLSKQEYGEAFKNTNFLELKNIVIDLWEYNCLKASDELYKSRQVKTIKEPKQCSDAFRHIKALITVQSNQIQSLHEDYRKALEEIYDSYANLTHHPKITEGNRQLLSSIKYNFRQKLKEECKKGNNSAITNLFCKKTEINTEKEEEIQQRVYFDSIQSRNEELERQEKQTRKMLQQIYLLMIDSGLNQICQAPIEKSTPLEDILKMLIINSKALSRASRLYSQTVIQQIFSTIRNSGQIFQGTNEPNLQQFVQETVSQKKRYNQFQSEGNSAEVVRLQDQIELLKFQLKEGRMELESVREELQQKIELIEELCRDRERTDLHREELNFKIHQQVRKLKSLQEENKQVKISFVQLQKEQSLLSSACLPRREQSENSVEQKDMEDQKQESYSPILGSIKEKSEILDQLEDTKKQLEEALKKLKESVEQREKLQAEYKELAEEAKYTKSLFEEKDLYMQTQHLKLQEAKHNIIIAQKQIKYLMQKSEKLSTQLRETQELYLQQQAKRAELLNQLNSIEYQLLSKII